MVLVPSRQQASEHARLGARLRPSFVDAPVHAVPTAACPRNGLAGEPRLALATLAAFALSLGFLGGCSTEPDAESNGIAQCPAVPEGVSQGISPGDRVPDATVYDCEGKAFSLHGLICSGHVNWVVSVPRWCPYSRALADYAENLHGSLASRGLRSLQIVYQDTEKNPATVEDCRLWRDAHGLKEVGTFFDPTGTTAAFFENSYTPKTLVIDRNRVIRFKHYLVKEADQRELLERALTLAAP